MVLFFLPPFPWIYQQHLAIIIIIIVTTAAVTRTVTTIYRVPYLPPSFSGPTTNMCPAPAHTPAAQISQTHVAIQSLFLPLFPSPPISPIWWLGKTKFVTNACFAGVVEVTCPPLPPSTSLPNMWPGTGGNINYTLIICDPFFTLCSAISGRGAGKERYLMSVLWALR